MEFGSSFSSVAHWRPLEFSGFQWARWNLVDNSNCKFEMLSILSNQFTLLVYCTISTDRSHLVMRDAHSSLTLMFTTSGDA